MSSKGAYAGSVPIGNRGHLVRAATLVPVIHALNEKPELKDGKISCHFGKHGLEKLL